MSSTQHQLIEQCATRLRGIVEALDNIHDTSPQRWSTDLDDVHSSAESLLALINDQAPARSDTSFEEWLANELEGEDGQPVPAAVCDIALARRAFNHWPKLEQPAKVGGVRFSAGVSSRLVVEAAQRLYEFESTPEKEAERPEVVGYRSGTSGGIYADGYGLEKPEKLMTVAQHERIVGALTRDHAHVEEHLSQQIDILRINLAAKRDNLDAALAEVERIKAISDNYYVICVERQQQLDTAPARAAELEAKLAELEKQEPVAWVEVIDRDYGPYNFHGKRLLPKGKHQLYAAPVAQAQHSVPEGWMLVECGIWTQEQVDEMQKTVARFRNSEFVDDRALAMAVADAGQCKAPEISLAELFAAPPVSFATEYVPSTGPR
ncbi:hypothetical protein ACT50N_12235 [Pseudomonas aeruginosa]